MITEREAQTKWCPFAKRLPYAGAGDAEEIAMVGINPEYADEMAARFPCIGSRCMAWRRSVPRDVQSVPEAQAESWIKAGWFVDVVVEGNAVMIHSDTGKGYCGMAGSA